MPSPMSLVVEALRVGASARGDSAGSPSFRRTYIALRNGLIGRGLDISAVESEPGSSGPAARLVQDLDTFGEDLDLLTMARDLLDAVISEIPADAGAEAGVDVARVRADLDAAIPPAVGSDGPRGVPPTFDGLPGGGFGFDGGSDRVVRGGGGIPPMAPPMASDPPEPGLLGDGAVPDVPAGQPAAPAPDPRWINAELEDHDPADPLPVDQATTLAFDVDLVARQESLGASRLEPVAFPDGVDEVTLTIQLDSDDVEISEHSRPLRLPRVGRSRGKARFDITPRKTGRCFLSAVVHQDGNFVQKLDLALTAGDANPRPMTMESTGRPPAAAPGLHPCDLTLIIEPATAGYSCTVINDGGGFGRVTLPITQVALTDAVTAARAKLMAVVAATDQTGDVVFQSGIDIPAEERDAALPTLARAGALLFQKVFSPPDGSAELTKLGALLRARATDPATRLQLQVVTKEFALPWAMLYVGDASSGAQLSWDNFVGMRHVVEQIPLADLSVQDQRISSAAPGLAVRTSMNTKIDADMRIDVVARQQQFWTDASAGGARLRLARSDTRDELLGALRDPADVNVLYFFCHATAPDPAARGGIGAAALGLAGASITLDDLELDAPLSEKLGGSPLVFVNACESAEMSPQFYDGFVPYFMAKGARGVVGTECKTPALFAAAWAERFFARFLGGEPLGEAVLGLRREFLERHGNPLGLLYSVHCDSDTHVEPALQVAGPAVP